MVAVGAEAISFRAALLGDVAGIGGEALPLRRNALVGLKCITGREADNQQLLAIEKSRRVELSKKSLVHSNRLHELGVGRKTICAQRLRRRSELPVKRASKGFM